MGYYWCECQITSGVKIYLNLRQLYNCISENKVTEVLLLENFAEKPCPRSQIKRTGQTPSFRRVLSLKKRNVSVILAYLFILKSWQGSWGIFKYWQVLPTWGKFYDWIIKNVHMI